MNNEKMVACFDINDEQILFTLTSIGEDASLLINLKYNDKFYYNYIKFKNSDEIINYITSLTQNEVELVYNSLIEKLVENDSSS